MRLGGPYNQLGMGDLSGRDDMHPEGYWLAINGRCEQVVNGDLFSSRTRDGERCAGEPNPYFRESGYHVGIDVAPGHQTMAIEVLVGKFEVSSGSAKPPNSSCGTGCVFATTFRVFAPREDPATARPLCEEVKSDLVRLDRTPRWEQLCVLPVEAPSGTYTVEVQSSETKGWNSYALRVRSGDQFVKCDVREDASCPRVHALDGLSIVATGAAQTGTSLYLGDIPADYRGGNLQVDLFDPGDIGAQISLGDPILEVLDPSDRPVEFEWSTIDDLAPASGGPTTKLDTSGVTGKAGRFNGRLLRLHISLADYEPAPGKTWWRVRYTSRAPVQGTDRTVWVVRAARAG